MKYQVWVKENGMWMEQGDGLLTLKEANRIAREIYRFCGTPARIIPDGFEVDPDTGSARKEIRE